MPSIGESVAFKIKLAFPDGNLKSVKSAISSALMEKAWEKLRLAPVNQVKMKRENFD